MVALRVVFKGSMSEWRPVRSGVPQGSVLAPVLLDIFVSHENNGIECTLSKFSNDSKLCGAVDTQEGRDGIQRDLDRLQRWAHVNFMKFSKAKCQALPMGWGNAKHKPRLGREWIESSPEEKTWGCWMTRKPEHPLGCIPSSVGSGRGRGLCPSAPLC